MNQQELTLKIFSELTELRIVRWSGTPSGLPSERENRSLHAWRHTAPGLRFERAGWHYAVLINSGGGAITRPRWERDVGRWASSIRWERVPDDVANQFVMLWTHGLKHKAAALVGVPLRTEEK
jgi:hypothetical protein